MANPKSSEKSQSTVSDTMQDATGTVRDTIRDTSSTLRDAADRFANRETREKAEELMSNASETASQIYERASSWLQENNRTVLMVGAFVAVGVVGYLLGRGVGSSDVTEIQSY